MSNQRKLRVGFVSNCPVGGKTGLGRNMKAILPLLYQKNKYEIFFLAQGMPENDPNFQKLPFKCESVFKNFDQNRFNQDPGYQRHVAYGNTAIEEFVVKNELDACIISDDFWMADASCYYRTNWYSHIKQNFMFVATADSEPLLPTGIEWAENCPNMRFWCKFPVQILNKKDPIKYKHCDVIYGALKIEDFKPLSKFEKQQLRKKFGIADDEKIVMYLGRNQLRKIYGSHIEGLAKFKKRHPNKKLRLLFHCSWSESMGWPLNQIREQNGLKPEDILTTYYCRNCGDWNVQPFQGEELDCPTCQAKKSRLTAGVGSTINEEDLNKIYNLADGSASIFTSGSFEYTNPESMLAGVPLAVPRYVCGIDFLDSNCVYEIKGNFYFEHNTAFKKFTPDINSVCDFFEYIYDLPESKRLELTTKARKWAVDNFDAKNVVKKYEEFLDKCQPIDWNKYHEDKKKLNNPSAQIEDNPDDEQFILQCYEKILANPNVKDNDINGFNYWKDYLKQPKDKNQLKNEMVNTFRGAAASHNQKTQQNPISLEDLLIKNNKKHFLIVCPQSAGDILYATSLLKSFRESYNKDEWNIYFACQPEFQELLDLNPNIDKVLPYHPIMDNEIGMLGQVNKGPFQGYSFLTAGSQKFLNYLGNHQINMELK